MKSYWKIVCMKFLKNIFLIIRMVFFLKKTSHGHVEYRDKYKQNKYVFHNLQYNLFWHIYEIYFNDNIFIIVYFEILSFLYCYNFSTYKFSQPIINYSLVLNTGVLLFSLFLFWDDVPSRCWFLVTSKLLVFSDYYSADRHTIL